MERGYVYTGVAAMLSPLNCSKELSDEEEEDEGACQPTTSSKSAELPLQKTPSFSTTNRHHVNAPVGSMEGHSSLAAYSQHHHQHHHHQHQQGGSGGMQQHEFQNPGQSGNPQYFHQQHHYQQQTSGGHNQMGYGGDYDQHNQASTSSGSMHQQQHHQYQHQHSFDQPHHQHHNPNMRYDHQTPHSAPPQQRNFVTQYPVKVVDPNTQQAYGQINRTVNAPPPIVTKPLPPPPTNPGASSVEMAPRKTPLPFKRQADIQEEQRMEYEVQRNVSQIMSNHGMKVSQQQQAMLSPQKSLPPLAQLPPAKSAGPTTYQCPVCNRNLANARNLQRHRQSCGVNPPTSIQVSTPSTTSHSQQAAPQLAAMLQRTSPGPSTSSAPSTAQMSTTPSSLTSSTFHHHNSTGNMTGYSQPQSHSSLYSPHGPMGDPNVMLSDGFDFKDDPMLFQGTSSSTTDLWTKDDSFGASNSDEMRPQLHDNLDLSDSLGFHLDGLDSEPREITREFREPDELETLDPNPQMSHAPFFGIDPELEPLLLDTDVEDPILRSESASLSSSSHGRNTPATGGFMCDACKKCVSSERSLRRHFNTCKLYQAEMALLPPEERPQPKRRGPAAKKVTKKTRTPPPLPILPPLAYPQPPERNSAILAALAAPPSVFPPPPPNFNTMMMAPTPTSSSSSNFQAPYPSGGALPSISASWLSSNNSSSSRSSDMFTPPMASSTPIYQKSSPLEDLLMEDDQTIDADDGDSRSSCGTITTIKSTGNPQYTCEHCSRQLCSMSNLKRHRSTCKAMVDASPAQPEPAHAPPTPQSIATPAPTQQQQQPLQVETTATVTYTKTDGPNNWSDKMMSPKQHPPQPPPQKNMPAAQTESSEASDSGWKKTMTVGEALKAQQIQNRFQIQPPAQNQMQPMPQMQNQGQMNQMSQVQGQTQNPNQMNRIPPRPPNPILNQMQNPPQQVQQIISQQHHHQQHQQQHQSRQAPQSQAQIVHQPLPPLSTAQLHAQLQLQSPKKGVIEVKNTDQVLITSEPLPMPQKPPPMVHDQRRSSEGQVSQPLPPLQLPQRKQAVHQMQSQIAYQVQFHGRPLPPMQLQPVQHQQQAQQQQMDMNQKQQAFQQSQMQQQPQNQRQMPQNQKFQQNQPQFQRQMGQGQAPMQMQQRGQAQVQMQQNPMQNQMQNLNQQQQFQQQQPQRPIGQGNQGQMNQNQMQQRQNMQQGVPMSSQQQQPMQMPPQNQQNSQQMQNAQIQMQHPHQQQQHNSQQIAQRQNSQLNTQQNSQQNMQQMPQNLQQPRQQQQNQMQQSSIPQTQQQQQHVVQQKSLPPLQMPPRKVSHTMEPPAKKMRSQSAAKPNSMDESSNRKPGSPLDSIITSVPLSVEVNHHLKDVEQAAALSSAETHAVPSPRKSHNQAYICPECDKIYSCRKNVKRHRMAVHKMTLDEVLAKPELPAPDDYVGPVGGASRRHTVAGLDFERTPSSNNNNNNNRSSAKRKASAAATASTNSQKKTKESAPKLNEEIQKQPTGEQVNEKAPSPDPISTPVATPATAPVQMQTSQMQFFPAQQQMMDPTVPQSAPHPDPQPAQQQRQSPSLSAPVPSQPLTNGSSLANSLPPLQLPPLGEQFPSWQSVTNSAPPTANPTASSAAISTSRITRSSEFSDDEDTKAMARIAAELKRSAEKWPGCGESTLNDVDHIDEDELLLQHIRSGSVLEDVGDIAHLLDGTDADSTFTDEMLDKALGGGGGSGRSEVTKTSTTSSVCPSLSSPEEHYYQYHQYQQQQTHQVMWNDGYDHQSYQSFEQSIELQPIQRHHSLAAQPHQFQEPIMPRPASQPAPILAQVMVASIEPAPAPRMKPGRKPSETPKVPADLHCSGCKKVLGSEYSLRRHKAGCAEVQNALNPNYPRPPQRRAARRAALLTEAEILASMPKPLSPQKLAERRAAAAEAVVERMEKLPPPDVVTDFIKEIGMEKLKKQSQSTSPPSSLTAQVAVTMQVAQSADASDAAPPSSSPSSSSSSTASSTSGGVQPQIQACNKHYSSEWNLDRHKREVCPHEPRGHSYEPSGPEDEIAMTFLDNSKRKVSRSLLCTASSLLSYWLDDTSDRLELDTKWEHFELLLDVHTLKVAITSDNVNLVAEQSKKYQLEQVVRMTEQFITASNH